MNTKMGGRLLWTPSPERVRASHMARYMDWLQAKRGLAFKEYSELWAWSVSSLDDFWSSLWEYFEIGPPTFSSVLAQRAMPGARWFPGAQLNYAARLLAAEGSSVAVVHRNEAGERHELTYSALLSRVARVRVGLRALGVSRGDRVVGYVVNGPEALIAFLATASLGAVWSSCPPEFGVESVLDRFSQISPKVLFACTSYRYGGKTFDRRPEVAKLRASLESLEASIWIGDAEPSDLKCVHFDDFGLDSEPLVFEPVPFDHPLWILFSSGTTGLPKPIVHGHGGMLLEHLKILSLHSDLGAGDRFFWFSTTGWMMWNYLIGGLLVGATVVLYDGSPAHPDLGALWRMAADEKVTYFGVSAPFLMACRAAGLSPRQYDLSALRAIGSTGAPLPPAGFEWVYERVGDDLLLGSVSGGTDLCTAFVAGCPILPVYSGELQCRALGADVRAFDANGHAVLGEVGELVIASPMPCMPIYFWNDEGGVRYRESYFDQYPGIWRHGDWIVINERGGAVIYGRSDATLNRGGVRMGTSEFYRIVEELDAIKDSVVVDTSDAEGNGKLWLFVVLAADAVLDGELLDQLKRTLRSKLSPRHVPDEVRAVRDVPRTLSGKKLEVPIKRLLAGAPLEDVVNPGTLQNPNALFELLAVAKASPEPGPSSKDQLKT